MRGLKFKSPPSGLSAAPPTVPCQITPAEITVGQHMTLTCTGAFASTPAANFQVIPDKPQDAYKLQVLSVIQSTPQEFRVDVTSYRTGKVDGATFKLSDGHITLTTSPISYTVASVMDPAHPTEKPYGSMGPFRLALPIWFWIALGLAIIAILAVLIGTFLRGRRRRQMRAEMDKFATKLPAFAEYSKDARQIARQLSAAADGDAPKIRGQLEASFRQYLIRELRVPALQVSDRELLKEIRRSHKRLYQQCEADLRRLFFELEKFRSSVTLKDCDDLLVLSRKLAERIYASARITAGARP